MCRIKNRTIVVITALLAISAIIVSAILVHGFGIHDVSLAAVAPTIAAIGSVMVSTRSHTDTRSAIHETNNRVERIDRTVNNQQEEPHRNEETK
jgi:hypothetical protein